MKTALLVAGDPRYLSKCITQLKYFSNIGVDIYFSLWESSAHKMPLLSKPVEMPAISEADIKNVLGDSCKKIIIESPNTSLANNFYKYIYRLQKGCQLLTESYDTLIVCRPDILINSPWELMIDPGDKIYHYYGTDNCLGDSILIGKPALLEKFFNSLHGQTVKITDIVQWHIYLYETALSIFSAAELINTWATMYRHPYFENNPNLFDKFRSLESLIATNFYIDDNWSATTKSYLNNIIEDFNSGQLTEEIDKYKNYFNDV